jgi:hypothetical protein
MKRCQHRDDGRGRCIDCGEFLDEPDIPLRTVEQVAPRCAKRICRMQARPWLDCFCAMGV